MTSLVTSVFTQRAQFQARRLEHDLDRREDLYTAFIQEASKLYTDAWEHDEADTAKLVNLYALLSRMRIRSSPNIVESADRVCQVIIETYLSPNKTFRDIPDVLKDAAMDPLREFSNACREELRNRRLR
jgi:hypothetical protein